MRIHPTIRFGYYRLMIVFKVAQNSKIFKHQITSNDEKIIYERVLSENAEFE